MKNNKPDIALIRKYLNGELDARAMYELERLAQDDPYLMDVMMGMEMSHAEQDKNNLFTIDQMIGERIRPATTRRMVPWRSWSIAASVVIGVSLAAFLFLKQPGEQQFTNEDKQAVQIDKNAVKPLADQKNVIVPEVPVIEKQLPSGDQIAAVPNKKSTEIVKYSRAELKATASPIVADAAVLNPAAMAAKFPVRGKIDSGTIAQLSDSNLNDVVVVGYGAANKPLAEEALAGKVAGLQITKRSFKGKPASPVQISGVVRDAEGNVPLAGVAVKVDKSSAGTATDANGRFTMVVPPGTEKLQIASIGYEIRTISINGRDSLNISLDADRTSLSEVVVTGYSRKIEKAHPVIGWKAYKVYLNKNAIVKDGKGAKVTVSFTVSANGIPANVKIIAGAGDSINQQAIALILNGPAWIGDSDGEAKEIIIKINFKK